MAEHVLIRPQDVIGIVSEVLLEEFGPDLLAVAEQRGPNRLGAACVAERVDLPPGPELHEARPRDLAGHEHRRDRLLVVRPIRRIGVLDAEDALGQGLVEERERLGACGVGNPAKRRAGHEEGRTQLFEVVAELVHRGVEPVPSELVLEAIGSQPRAVLGELRSHRVAGSPSDLDPDPRSQELGVVVRPAEATQDLGKLRLELRLVTTQSGDLRVHLLRVAGLEEVVEVDVVGLEGAFESRFQKRREITPDRCREKIDEKSLDLLLRNLAFQSELPGDRGGVVSMVLVEGAGHRDVVHPVVVSEQVDRLARRFTVDRVRLGIPVAGRRFVHDRLRKRSVDVPAHGPREGTLLVNAVGVVVAGLDLLADEPVGEQATVRLEPSSPGSVHHGSDRDVEVRDPVVALEVQFASKIRDRLGNAGSEATDDAGLGPSRRVPVSALREHLAQRRLLEIEQRDEREFLGVELFDEIRSRVEGRQERVGLRQRVAHQIAPAPQIASHLVEMAADLLRCGLESVEKARSVLRVRCEVGEAERAERLIIPVRWEPAIGALGHAASRGRLGGLAVGVDDRVDRGLACGRGERGLFGVCGAHAAILGDSRIPWGGTLPG